jgi:hypothetical protein
MLGYRHTVVRFGVHYEYVSISLSHQPTTCLEKEEVVVVPMEAAATAEMGVAVVWEVAEEEEEVIITRTSTEAAVVELDAVVDPKPPLSSIIMNQRPPRGRHGRFTAAEDPTTTCTVVCNDWMASRMEPIMIWTLQGIEDGSTIVSDMPCSSNGPNRIPLPLRHDVV